MCGIAGILNIKVQTKELRDKVLKMAQKIRHRGPEMCIRDRRHAVWIAVYLSVIGHAR